LNNRLTCCFFSNFAANIDDNDCENMMKTTIQQQDGNIVAVLEGRLDTAAAAVTEKSCSHSTIVTAKTLFSTARNWNLSLRVVCACSWAF